MKALILIVTSLFTMNVMAATSNFNCAAQAKSDRDRCQQNNYGYNGITSKLNCTKNSDPVRASKSNGTDSVNTKSN
jgi:hypothetical protein